jgi:hypothetical protein
MKAKKIKIFLKKAFLTKEENQSRIDSIGKLLYKLICQYHAKLAQAHQNEDLFYSKGRSYV